MKQHLALYGNVQIVRAYCYKCGRHALVVDEHLQCCDRRIETTPAKTRRMSQPEQKRRRLKQNEKDYILNAQEHKCLYCDASFDGYVEYHGELRKVKITWDHMAPYTYNAKQPCGEFCGHLSILQCLEVKPDFQNS